MSNAVSKIKEPCVDINEIPACGGLDALMDEQVMCQPRNLDCHYSVNLTDALEIVSFLNRQGFTVVMCAPDSGAQPSMIYRGAASADPARDVFLNLAYIEESRRLLGMPAVRVQAITLSLAICHAAFIAATGSSIVSIFSGPPKLRCPIAASSPDDSIGPGVGARDVVGPHMGGKDVIGPYMGHEGQVQVGG